MDMREQSGSRGGQDTDRSGGRSELAGGRGGGDGGVVGHNGGERRARKESSYSVWEDDGQAVIGWGEGTGSCRQSSRLGLGILGSSSCICFSGLFTVEALKVTHL